MKGHLLMSEKERKRKADMVQVAEGKLRLHDAARRLGISYRQCRRIWKRYREQGDRGLVHGNRGRPSRCAKDKGFRDAVVARYEKCYKDYGPTLASEKLAEEDGLEVNRETLRRWLRSEGLWAGRRVRARHRARRERRERFGELVQMDGSHHEWFGEAHGRLCLVQMIDDATGERLALLFEQETTEGCMRALWSWIERYGVPQALYADRKNVFVTDREPTLEEQLAGKEPRTAFGLACEKLGIELVTARSAQAKGRVERAHAVYQDRFVKELALKGITTIEGANQLLQNGFTRRLNEKFARAPHDPADAHRALPKHLVLSEVFCHERTRTLSNDWTVRDQNCFFQILKHNDPLPKPRDKVLVRRLLDGTVQILLGEAKLRFKAIAAPQNAIPRHHRQAAKITSPAVQTQTRTRRPSPDHPWRRMTRMAKARIENK